MYRMGGKGQRLKTEMGFSQPTGQQGLLLLPECACTKVVVCMYRKGEVKVVRLAKCARNTTANLYQNDQVEMTNMFLLFKTNLLYL